MPSLIKKREKLKWRASVTVRGEQREKTFPDDSKKSERDAILWEEQTRAQMEKGPETPTVSVSVEQWLQEYLDDAQDRFSTKTYKEKQAVFAEFAKERGVTAEMPVEAITKKMCLDFLKKQFKTRSGYSANKDRKNMAAGWEYGKENIEGWPEGIINPFRSVKKFPEKRHPRYVPPESDFWTVYDKAEGQDRVMLITFLHLAGRKGEIFRLKWSDVDWESNRIRLWTRKREGGNMEYDWLPMTRELKAALSEWRKERFKLPVSNKEHIFICLDRTEFCKIYYGKPFKVRQHFMARLCEAAEVTPFGFHSIRHLTASILYRKGYPVAVIQAILRHQNPYTTTKYLKSLGLEQTREALEEGLRGPAKVILFRNEKCHEVAASEG